MCRFEGLVMLQSLQSLLQGRLFEGNQQRDRIENNPGRQQIDGIYNRILTKKKDKRAKERGFSD